jgi:hypothetical protein
MDERMKQLKAERQQEIEDMWRTVAAQSEKDDRTMSSTQQMEISIQFDMNETTKEVEKARMACDEAVKALREHKQKVNTEQKIEQQKTRELKKVTKKLEQLRTTRQKLETESEALMVLKMMDEPVRLPNNDGSYYYYWQGIDFGLSLWRLPTDHIRVMQDVVDDWYPVSSLFQEHVFTLDRGRWLTLHQSSSFSNCCPVRSPSLCGRNYSTDCNSSSTLSSLALDSSLGRSGKPWPCSTQIRGFSYCKRC